MPMPKDEIWQGKEALQFIEAILVQIPLHLKITTYEKSLLREFRDFLREIHPDELFVTLQKNMITATVDTDAESHDSYMLSLCLDDGGVLAVCYDNELIQEVLPASLWQFALQSSDRAEKRKS